MISLEKVLSSENMLEACRRVIAKKGAPGVDGMTVYEIEKHLNRRRASIYAHIRKGTYIPSPVRRVDIPKSGGGTRMLGIPTVQDRVIQQAIAQALTAHFDRTFSEFGYGFREGRSAHQAVEQTQRYIAEGRSWVLPSAHGSRPLTGEGHGGTQARCACAIPIPTLSSESTDSTASLRCAESVTLLQLGNRRMPNGTSGRSNH